MRRARILRVGAVVLFLLAAFFFARRASLIELRPRASALSPNGKYRVLVLVHTFPESLVPTMPGDGIGNRSATVRLLDAGGRVLDEGPVIVFGHQASANELEWVWENEGVKFRKGSLWRTPTSPIEN